MKKKYKGSIGIIIVAVIIIAVILSAIFLGDKKLDLESEQVKTLYRYLGEVDVNHCGGLNAYAGDEVTYKTISNENKLCMAYYELTEDQIVLDTQKVSEINEFDVPVCEICEGIRLASEEEDSYCNYQIITAQDLKDSYQKIYNQDMPDDESFYISINQACFLEEGKYYCGNSETSKVTMMPETTIYRMLNSASIKINGDIVITDFYLRVSNNKCYANNSNDEEITNCSALLEGDKEITKELVQEYGVLYEHVFKQDKNGNYYWYSSNIK